MQADEEMRFDPRVGKILLRSKWELHSSTLAWRIPQTEGPAGYSPRVTKSRDTTEVIIRQGSQEKEPGARLSHKKPYFWRKSSVI